MSRSERSLLSIENGLNSCSEWYIPFSQNMFDPAGTLYAFMRSSVVSGSERGVRRERGMARRGKSEEREISVLNGSEEFLMREIACGPRSVGTVRSIRRVKTQGILESSSLVKVVVKSISSVDSACARIAFKMGSATCWEVSSLELSSVSTN